MFDDFGFKEGQNDLPYHGRELPWTQYNEKIRSRGIDWGKVRLNFGYGQDETPENVFDLNDYREPEIPWGWIYAGGLLGVLSLVWIMRKQ